MSLLGIKISEKVVDKVAVIIGAVWINIIAIALIISAVFGIAPVYAVGVGFAGCIIIVLNYGLLSIYIEVDKNE